MRKVVITSNCIDSICVWKGDKDTAKAIAHTDYEFDENGEVELTMEFHDGIAYDVNGSGLVMTYPKAEKVQKFTILQNCIVAYTGIDDGYINQYDIALKYGKLEWRPEEVELYEDDFDEDLDDEFFDDPDEGDDDPDYDDPDEGNDEPEPENKADDYQDIIDNCNKVAADALELANSIIAKFA